MNERKLHEVDGKVRTWDDMTDIQKENYTYRRQQKFKEVFGYIPNIKDYFCTPELYADALRFSVIREVDCFKKPLSEYLINKKQNLNDCTEEQWTKYLAPLYAGYQRMCRYIPNESDYICTRDMYIEALIKSLEEKKEISQYLKEI